MGEVYRARDTKLKRTVAIKVVLEGFSRDPERVARLEREAEMLATLNHPHIAAIYGLEESNGIQALVLELVEGPTLADRLLDGPLPVDQALAVACQIAAALEAAHNGGIVHRDLKPANIKMRLDGMVKVLDFGLAKAFGSSSFSGDLTQSPTVLSPTPTVAGVILGTARYMSPEQARGKTVDKRTDVWAFGCVLFEMLTGKPAFDGDTFTDVAASIVRNEPEWRALPPSTPPAIRALIVRCLKKDPAHRLQEIADGRFQIEDALNEPGNPLALVVPVKNHRERAAWTTALLLLGATVYFASRPSINPSTAAISFPVFPGEKSAFSPMVNTTVNVPSFALSPDGQFLVFSAEAQGGKPALWLRSLDRVNAHELAGTDNAQDPMWSPDGRWIAFFADGKLKKIPAAGGPVQVLTQTATDFRGGTWAPEGRILFASGTVPIMSVDATGGAPAPVTQFDESQRDTTHRNPHLLPDGRHFLYSVMSGRPDQNGVYVGSVDGKIKKRLLQVNTSAVYAPPGYLLFADGDALLAQVFDAQRLELSGQPFVVAEHAGRNTAFMSAVSASRTGTLAYAGIVSQAGRLTWIDRGGKTLAAVGAPDGDYTDFRLAPDETRLAASLFDPKSNAIEIWLTDLVRRSSSRVALAGGLVTASALWAPNGTRLIYRSNVHGIIEFYERSAAGGGSDRQVLSLDAFRAAHLPSLNLVPTDWSPDGRSVIFSAAAAETANDLWLLPLATPEPPAKFIASPGDQLHANLSPDGSLVAYSSNESGQFEIYVETIPRSDRKVAVSASGGYEPRWRADGREIYYLSPERKLMAVAVGAGPTFGIPKALFQTQVRPGVSGNRSHYVPSRDGQRFLVNTALDAPDTPITVIVNWAAALKK
jgi:eukaryotic-like serine/threonine-protein kinase